LAGTLCEEGHAQEHGTSAILKKEGRKVSGSYDFSGAVHVFVVKGGKMMFVHAKSGRAEVGRMEPKELIERGRSPNGGAEVWHVEKGGEPEKRRAHAVRGSSV
jgi:hypothetical protein